MNLKNAIFGGSVTGISDRSGAYDGSIQAWLPIKDIVQGVVVTRDKRFVKILELLPVNFYTMSSMDKSAAIDVCLAAGHFLSHGPNLGIQAFRIGNLRFFPL